jgi:hypothetical protein
MRGNYQHCAKKNLHRYLISDTTPAQITDGERAVLAMRSGVGERLTYRQPHHA